MIIETVKFKGKIIAHIYRKQIRAKGARFLTPYEYTLQVGLIEHPKSTIIKEHIHRQDIKYRVDTTQEFLFIEKGKVRINLFNDNWRKVKTAILKGGDFILFVSGGHGFKILKKCRIIEVKQGPYPGDKKAKIRREDKHG